MLCFDVVLWGRGGGGRKKKCQEGRRDEGRRRRLEFSLARCEMRDAMRCEARGWIRGSFSFVPSSLAGNRQKE
jgi:hypothetical protein